MEIKDSGNRTEFDSGAVRDMREGKGRMDLVPFEVMANILNDSKFIGLVRDYLVEKEKETPFATSCLYDAINEFCRIAYTNERETMLLEVGIHFEQGAKKYGEHNWQKVIPTYCYIDSAIRHYLKWRRGDQDEPHDRAVVWNLMCCIWEEDYSARGCESDGEDNEKTSGRVSEA